MSDDQRVLPRKERWEIFLYPDAGCLEAGGEVAGEVVEARVTVFKAVEIVFGSGRLQFCQDYVKNLFLFCFHIVSGFEAKK